MPSYQYYFVVLAGVPELYGYLQGLHSDPAAERNGQPHDDR